MNIDIRKLESEIFNKMNMDSYNSLTWKVITVSSIPSVALRWKKLPGLYEGVFLKINISFKVVNFFVW